MERTAPRQRTKNGRRRRANPAAAGARIARQNAWSEWFRDQLEDRDLTQEAAARELGIPLATFSRWCRGYSEPTMDHAMSIVRVWGILPDLKHLATLEYFGGNSRSRKILQVVAPN